MIDSNSPTTPAEPAPSTSVAPGGLPAALTAPPGTALQIAQLLAAGKVDTAQAGKLSKAANVDTLAVARALHTLREVGDAQPDGRSPEVKELDAAFPPARPEEFTIRYGVPGQEPETTPELKQFDQSARTWLSGAGFPRETGNSLVNAIAKVTQQTQHMTEGELESSYGHKEFEKLQRVHGEKLEERLQAAGRMVEALEQKQPGLKNLLKSRGIGNNAMVANMLIAHAQIYHARKGR